MGLALPDLRHIAYDHPEIGPALGFYGVATQVTGLALTDPDGLGRTNYGQNHFAGKGLIVLPNRSGADREKQAGRISGDVLTLDDTAAYTATFTNEPYEFIKGGRGPESITIARLNSAAQRALRRIYFDTRAAVSQLWPDGDLGAADIAPWTPSGSSSAITIEKSADPSNNRPGGLYSILANYVTSGQYFSSATGYDAQAGDRLWIAALPIVLSPGTTTLKIYDTTNNVQLGQTMSVTGKGAFHMGTMFTVTRSCNVNFRAGADAGMQVAWDCFPSHAEDGLNWEPLDWIDANWKLYGIDVMNYGRDVAQGVQNANTGQPERWQPRLDYTTSSNAEDASPGLIQVMRSIHRTVPGRDLFYYGRRRESDHAQLNDEIQTTNADRDFLEAAYLSEACAMLEARDKLGSAGTWQMLKRDFDLTVNAQRVARQPAAPQPRQIRRVVSI